MKDYFILQWKITNRKIEDLGIPIFLGYAVSISVFFILSDYLFSRIDFGPYIYILVSLSLVSRLSDIDRNDYLKLIFRIKDYWKLRIIENFVFVIPFLVFLFLKQLYLHGSILMIGSLLLTFTRFSFKLDFTIPTPFSRKPFEFPIGFRKTALFFPVAYFFAIMSIFNNNNNLGYFSIITICGTCISYYFFCEDEYIVWNHKISARNYLFSKAKTCLFYFTILVSPMLIALAIFFNETDILLYLYLVCTVYLLTTILTKYAAFPQNMDLLHTLLFSFSIMFPPILLFLIPFFYRKSINNIKPFLSK